MEYSIKFWDKMANRYSRRPVSDVAAYEKKLSLTQQYFKPDMKVLEFGCGTGSTALEHAPHVGSYLAIDVSPRMVDIARQKLAGRETANLSFDVATLEDFRQVREEYDAILGLNILHLMEDPEAVINQVFSMLKPGGVFVSNTACLKNTRPYLKLITPLGKLLGFMPYVKFLSRKELEGMLKSAGFNISYQWVPETTRDVYFLIAEKPE
ncbi:SAM-dependent methyltransferase [Hahella sp. CCB-MM4]|nr:SAM-dependent methyltransferase [Hahella sp. CCB-MM4]